MFSTRSLTSLLRYHYITPLHASRGKSAKMGYKVKSFFSFPVAQLVEHGASNAKIMGSIPRESKSW